MEQRFKRSKPPHTLPLADKHLQFACKDGRDKKQEKKSLTKAPNIQREVKFVMTYG